MNYVIDIQGYEKSRIGKDGGIALDWLVMFRVHANSPEEAIEKAKKLYKCKHYRIHYITETHEEIDQEMRMAQLEMQAKLLKGITGGK